MNGGPTIRRGKSEQSVRTPPEFLMAVEGSFGKIMFDLAASADNSVANDWYDKEENSLMKRWPATVGLHWLNPEFANIAPWAMKCAESRTPKAPITLLAPASIGSNWYWDYCHDQATTLVLHPRLRFVGHKDPYPKDLMLLLYRSSPGGRIVRWYWQEQLATEALS